MPEGGVVDHKNASLGVKNTLDSQLISWRDIRYLFPVVGFGSFGDSSLLHDQKDPDGQEGWTRGF